MDRPVSTPVASPPGLDDLSPSGWDPHAVWQQRVRDPHLRAQSRSLPPKILLAERSVGWDPTETWRLRVQRPRKALA